MHKLTVMVSDSKGTVLDSAELEVTSETVTNTYRLRREAMAALEDINWNRISNILGDE